MIVMAIVSWAGVLCALATIVNIVQLSPSSSSGSSESTTGSSEAVRALGVESLGDVRVSHLRELGSLSDFTKVFVHLGQRAKYVSMERLAGKYEARWLPLGIWRSLLLMGESGLDITKSGGGGGGGGAARHILPVWKGQRFIGETRITSAWGDNLYRVGSGQETRGHAFFVEYDIASAIDGEYGSAFLDYGSHGGNGWSLASATRGELRCFNDDLCIGLSGYWFSGGVRNGMPYVLFRPGADSKSKSKPKRRKQKDKTSSTKRTDL